MINNRAEGEAIKLHSVRSIVYEPPKEWMYSHHAHITYFNGRFLAIWSNGRINEDEANQRVMLAESEDGEHWGNPKALVTPEMLGNEYKVLLAAGFHVHEDTLYVYYGSYDNVPFDWLKNTENRPQINTGLYHENTDLGYVSTKDCIKWTEPKSLGIQLVPNYGPQKTNSGRLIISGNIMFPYTDNPDGVSDYRITGIYGDAFGNLPPVDDSESIQYVTAYQKWNANLISEGSFYQTDDEKLHMMLRSNSERLWHSESIDDGKTWSEPKPTEYTDDGSKFHFGRLPDGRFYCVSNAKVKSRRCPLDLYLSEDGENFNKHFIIRDEPFSMKVPGRHKGGTYGYPHTLIHGNEMFVIYSKQKEVIEVTRFSLDQL